MTSLNVDGLPTLWQGDDDATPGIINMIYGRAAELITRDGYAYHLRSHMAGDPWSLSTAIEQAAKDVALNQALEYPSGLEEEAGRRLAGAAILIGSVRRVSAGAYGAGGYPDAGDADSDELSKAEALALLGLAIQLVTAAGSTVAPQVPSA